MPERRRREREIDRQTKRERERQTDRDRQTERKRAPTWWMRRPVPHTWDLGTGEEDAVYLHRLDLWGGCEEVVSEGKQRHRESPSELSLSQS